MSITLSEVKEFLKIESDVEDGLVNSLIKASEGYIYNATELNSSDITNDNQLELYKLAQKLLISHWYENREVIGKSDKLAFSLGSILSQIKYCNESCDKE